jgi:hypothetical protein
MRSIVLAIVFLYSSSLLFAQSAAPKTGPATSQPGPDHKTTSAPSEDDVTALREDIARMRAILGQMETNLAFVDTTQSPLKHQFQLEIDMWNTMINDMERRLRPHTK